MNYEQLKNAIIAVIKQNGNEEITGDILQQVLVAMVNSLGNGYQFRGVAVPATAPGTPDQRVFYLASVTGTYPNFGLTVSDEICALVYDTEWHKETIIALDQEPTENSGNLISSGAIYTALQDLAGAYMQLVESAVENHLAIFDGDGQVKDAGIGLDGLALPDGRYPNLFAGFAGNLVDTRSAGTPQSPYTFRQSGGDGVDYLKRIKGRTLVWNQLVQNGDFADGTTGWGGSGFYPSDYSAGGGVLTITPADTSTQKDRVSVAQTLANSIIAGHTYLVKIEAKVSEGTKTLSGRFAGVQNDAILFSPSTVSTSWATFTATIAASYKNTRLMLFFTGAVDNAAVDLRNVMLVDLTLLGWVPSSVSEFRALFPLSYYSYTPGLLINNAATDMESTGFNQWDEVARSTGYIDANGNVVSGYGSRIASENYIPVIAGQAYFVKAPYTIAANGVRVAWYDANKALISVSDSYSATLTAPANAAYMRFNTAPQYASTTYNHDICINLSDPDRNGTYEPYWKATRHLGLDSIQAKDVGSDTIVTINGLDGVGDNVDRIEDGKTLIKNRARVDLGTLDWVYNPVSETYPYGYFSRSKPVDMKSTASSAITANAICSKYVVVPSNIVGLQGYDKAFAQAGNLMFIADSAYTDAATFKTAMAGVILDYPLATPKEYELVEPIQPLLEVDDLGTERRLPEDTADAVNAPFESDSNYSISTANLVRKLSQ